MDHFLLILVLSLGYFTNSLADATSESHTQEDAVSTEGNTDNVPRDPSTQSAEKRMNSYVYSYPSADIMDVLRPWKRSADYGDSQMPGVLRFGKRSQSFIRFGRSADFDDDGTRMLSKKEMPGVLRFGKRGQQEKKAVPGVLRFGKRDDIPGVLRFGKREMDVPGVLRFGKRDGDMPGVLRFGKRDDIPGVLRFGKRYMESNYLPAGVLRFGKRDGDMPGVLRFGKKSDMPGVLRFGKRSTDMPGVLRFG
ncbi:FMRFamide-like neuropeptide [Ditylenchus destructor]|nr:FMRFamide-like neuropeptide [Ditylenchus destructor]